MSIQENPQSPSPSLCLLTSVYMCVCSVYTRVCVCSLHTRLCVLCIHVCVSCAYTYVCSMHTCVHTFSVPSMHRHQKRRLGALIYHSTPDSAETASFSEPGARLAICRP